MEVTTRYGEFITLGQTLLADNGVEVTYGQNVEELTGQATNADDRVEQTHKVNVFFDDEIVARQSGSFMPEDKAGAIMEAGLAFEPTAGDFLITPQGKRYPVTSVTSVAPDGVPLYYELILEDG